MIRILIAMIADAALAVLLLTGCGGASQQSADSVDLDATVEAKVEQRLARSAEEPNLTGDEAVELVQRALLGHDLGPTNRNMCEGIVESAEPKFASGSAYPKPDYRATLTYAWSAGWTYEEARRIIDSLGVDGSSRRGRNVPMIT